MGPRGLSAPGRMRPGPGRQQAPQMVAGGGTWLPLHLSGETNESTLSINVGRRRDRRKGPEKRESGHFLKRDETLEITQPLT